MRWRWLGAASLIALVVCAVALAQTGGGGPAARPGLVIGVDANTRGFGLDHEQRVVNQLGVGWIREELDWSDIEPRQGVWRFAATDRLMLTAARRRLRVLPLLVTSPRWIARRPFTVPPDPAPWARFVERIVRRYGRGGSFWRAHPELDDRLAANVYELWNEPFFASFSAGGPNPARYARAALAAIRAGKSADPGARFLVALDTVYQRAQGGTASWIDALAGAEPELLGAADGFTVHPYTPRAPGATDRSRSVQFRRLDDIISSLREHGVARPRLWLTEIGWTTCQGSDPYCVSEGQQAQYLRQMFRLVSTDYADTVDAVFVYAMEDGGYAPEPDNPLRHFGLRRRDGSHKPSWRVVALAARAARG